MADVKNKHACYGCQVELELFFPNPAKIDTGLLDMGGCKIFSDVSFETGGKHWQIWRCPKCGMLYAYEEEKC